MYEHPLAVAAMKAGEFLSGVDGRFVGPCPEPHELAAALGGVLPAQGEPAERVIEQLAEHADPGIVASMGGRYFGFVVGGAHPAGVAADWLVSAWDQNVGFYVLSPAAAVIEQVVSEWLLDLLGLPEEAAVGFVTGCQMANFMGLAAGRQAALTRVGWHAARDGLYGAPELRVIVSEAAHGTIDRALAMLGLGSRRVTRIDADDQGRMCVEALRETLSGVESEQTIVCAQAGNVNTGSFDPLREIGGVCRSRGAWLHVDGAFGLWARASASLRGLADGAELADSWATDAHKWLNVPYDSGVVVVRDRAALLAATDYPGDYLVRTGCEDRCAYTPESSRRARAVPIYATLRSLGRAGVESLIERGCALARRAAVRLEAGGARVLNDVVLNKVLFVFPAPEGADQNAWTDRVIQRVQRDGTCWLGGTRWGDGRAMRLSVSGWRTTEADIDRSVAAIVSCANEYPRQDSNLEPAD